MTAGIFPMLKTLLCVSLEAGCGPHTLSGCHASHHSDTPLTRTDHRTPGVDGSLLHADRSKWYRLLQCPYRVAKCASACTLRPDCFGENQIPFYIMHNLQLFNKTTFLVTICVTEAVLYLQWWEKEQTRTAPCSFYFQINVISINSQLMPLLIIHYILGSLLQTVISLTSS